MFCIRFLANFPAGMFIGSIIAFGIAWLIDADIGTSETRNYTYLVSALVTLGAASLALLATLASIENQNKIAHEGRIACRRAANATLPLVLSAMTKVAKRGAETSMRHKIGTATNDELIAELRLPDEVIPALKEAIQYANPKDADRLANLIRMYQVLFSRMVPWLDETHPAIGIDQIAAINWAIFYRLVDDCYGYSRNEKPKIPERISVLELHSFFLIYLRLPAVELNNLSPYIEHREAMQNPEIN